MSASASTFASGDLVRDLLATLLHDVANTTQRLVGVRALLDFEDPTLDASASSDLLWASERAQEQGWLMGLLACALDVDLLLERRWSAGLGATLALVGATLARNGRSVRSQRMEAPLLSGELSVRDEARLCLALAAVVFDAGQAGGAAGVELVFERRERGLALRGSSGAAAALAAHERVRDALQEASDFEREGDEWAVRMPGSWFAPAADVER